MMDITERLQIQSDLAQLPLNELSAAVSRREWLIKTIDRPEQRPPPEKWTPETIEYWGRTDVRPGDLRDDWFFWLMMAGRGAGKTRAGAEDAWWFGSANAGIRYAVIGPTSQDTRKTCFEGESGLLARVPKELISTWNRGEMVLTLTNGSMYQGYSADEPDRLRGPQHHRAWCDELAAWRYLDDTLDNLLMGLRLGEMPRIVATTTPRPIKRLKEIVADETTVVDTVSTYANMKNLPKLFVQKILARYEGTRKGRQELHAEILTDNPGALWQRVKLDETRVVAKVGKGLLILADGRLVTLRRIVVGVDPASGGLGEDGVADSTGDEVGIVVVGLGDDGRGYVLADCTVAGMTPGEWGEAAVKAYDDWQADRIIYEANQGGEMVRHTIVTSAAAMRTAGKRKIDFVPVQAVWASRGKVTRAEPVSALYEQSRISHVGCHATLEDQMCEFTANFDRKKMGYSPDRVDALVWAVYHLMLDDDAGTNVQDYYRQESSRHAESIKQMTGGLAKTTTPGDLVELIPAPGVTTAFGQAGHMYSINQLGRMEVHPQDVEPLVRSGFTHPPEEEAA